MPDFIAKARADGARSLVLTPTAVTADHWGALVRASLPVDGAAYQPFRHPLSLLSHHRGFQCSELAPFAVDFGPIDLGSRPTSTSASPPTPLGRHPHPLPSPVTRP
jgi:hypothetical protein